MSDAVQDAAALPDAGRYGRLHRALFARLCASLHHGALTITTPDGRQWHHRAALPGPEAALNLHRWRALSRLFFGGDVAFAEAYGDGDWSSPDLATLVELAAVNGETLDTAARGNLAARLWNRLLHALRANNRSGSRRNIIAHYDLGNEFFASWLDAGMSYSSGIYRDADTTLDEAQTAKQDRAIALLELGGGDSVLEIGIGWGGLAERLLTTSDARLTGVTLSPSQLGHAKARLEKGGLAPRADLRLQDYRDVTERFDRIVSIEMFEAVGEAYWPAYFQMLHDRLLRGGTAVIQVITIEDRRFDTYRRQPDFIQRHIFPGGMLPTVGILHRQAATAGLVLDHEERFGHSYARTLAEWHERFLAVLPEVTRLGLDERFQRLWRYYLAYCEGGFRAGAIDVGLYRLRRAG
ncbi:class I SAM-dependent methyltransferase [Rhodovarius crocodyli]|uniref:Class I SAM-dependent methyltransferase n=1 Tax=Rhodovarius crocodyli TaxID=1979269 RepID=A0A437M3K1_9PROT|nr:cyclopropane-fatty-acyl-phospholipid synthase family protein [Rhodovarius crocodyli]RVT92277.1 class I SAM-dependent methyltransferase [Rhodovarius crocodyli]